MKKLISICLLATAFFNGHAQEFRFDLSGNRKVLDGYTAINSQSVYNDSIGYGYDLQSAPEKGSKDPFFFSVKVPDGNYRVSITLGNKKQAGVTTVRGESRRLFAESIATKRGETKVITFT